jgi:hypothetical protein
MSPRIRRRVVSIEKGTITIKFGEPPLHKTPPDGVAVTNVN